MAVRDAAPLPAREALGIAVMCIADALNTYGHDKKIAQALVTVRDLRDACPREDVVWGETGRRRNGRHKETALLVEEEGQLVLPGMGREIGS